MKRTRTLPLLAGFLVLGIQSASGRVQDQERPAPAQSQEVEIAVEDQDVVLAGTILLPAGATPERPVAGVVLITGSGPQDRDESLMGKKPFKVLAEGLVEHGYAVLRYDDRGTLGIGIGKSTGSFAGSTTVDFAIDAAAAVDYLAAHPAVDASKIIVCGHSTGGLVTAKLLGQNKVPAAAVLLASPSVIGWELLAYQSDKILRVTDEHQPTGLTPEQIDEMDQLQTEMIRSVAVGTEAQQRDAARAAIEFNVRLSGTDPAALTDEIMDTAIAQALAPMQETWMAYFMRYDPAEDLGSARVPVLAIFGGRDLQVAPEQNMQPMSEHIRAANDNHSAVMVLETSNHLFQHAETGLLTEYATAGDPMEPLLIDLVAAWLNRVLAE
ncbi:MAG: alpha/beta fold hydrolase [Phycisphaera sp.]|nr:MAG: alpha/beta fold hydrolase [Phycisphaera sp.]